MLSSDVPQDSSQQMGRFQAESALLKSALCQQIQAMAQNGGGGMDGGRRSMDGSGGPGRDMNEMMMRQVAAAGGNATNLAMLANQSAQGLMHLARGVGPGSGGGGHRMGVGGVDPGFGGYPLPGRHGGHNLPLPPPNGLNQYSGLSAAGDGIKGGGIDGATLASGGMGPI
mmetsp:Transcript_51957/g.144969  ORF Transcript_51957/g.144969 Transcript_51957/m.144969 type:complete len:170 (+) Transcript_51957:288-797(+)